MNGCRRSRPHGSHARHRRSEHGPPNDRLDVRGRHAAGASQRRRAARRDGRDRRTGGHHAYRPRVAGRRRRDERPHGCRSPGSDRRTGGPHRGSQRLAGGRHRAAIGPQPENRPHAHARRRGAKGHQHRSRRAAPDRRRTEGGHLHRRRHPPPGSRRNEDGRCRRSRHPAPGPRRTERGRPDRSGHCAPDRRRTAGGHLHRSRHPAPGPRRDENGRRAPVGHRRDGSSLRLGDRYPCRDPLAGRHGRCRAGHRHGGRGRRDRHGRHRPADGRIRPGRVAPGRQSLPCRGCGPRSDALRRNGVHHAHRAAPACDRLRVRASGRAPGDVPRGRQLRDAAGRARALQDDPRHRRCRCGRSSIPLYPGTHPLRHVWAATAGCGPYGNGCSAVSYSPT